MTKQLPPPISASNCFGWTRVSIFERLPVITQKLVEQAQLEKKTAETLVEEIKTKANLKQLKTGPEPERWNLPLTKHNYTWETAPWFFLESYFYRRILDSTEYFSNNKDPFFEQKKESLNVSLNSIEQMASSVSQTFLVPTLTLQNFKLMVYMDLWGNKADLSRNPTGFSQHDLLFELEKDTPNILIDKIDPLFQFVKSQSNIRIDFILDNVGLEFVCDLCLADLLVHYGHAKTIVFHFKYHPVFVSDVIIPDLQFTLEKLQSLNSKTIGPMISRWKNYLKEQTWITKNDPYWNSFEPFWEMPLTVQSDLDRSGLVFVKGDANARRVHGDLRWDFKVPTEEIASYFGTNMCIVRTLKSETVSGLTDEQIKSLSSCSDWYFSGNFGEINFIKKVEKQ